MTFASIKNEFWFNVLIKNRIFSLFQVNWNQHQSYSIINTRHFGCVIRPIKNEKLLLSCSIILAAMNS